METFGVKPESSITLALACLLLLIYPQVAHGDVKQYQTPILGVTTSANGFNGCLMKVRPVPNTLYCTNRSNHTFLTLDCSGQWVSRADAERNLKQAQIALISGKNVNIVVNDRFSIEPQGYCLAQQITVLR
jgi:hypothetical protein